jgi:hypothetical protein
MRGPCCEKLAGDTVVDGTFANEFRATLLIHHYFLRAPLATSSFDAAFIRAAERGWTQS